MFLKAEKHILRATGLLTSLALNENHQTRYPYPFGSWTSRAAATNLCKP